MRVLWITVLAAFAVAAPSGASWSPDRATGAPDVAAAGDNVNAWAPMQANAGIEWLDLGFPKATKVARVRVRESFNPGALVRVTAWEAGREVDLWSGASVQKDGAVWFVVKPERSVLTDRVRLYLDTSKVAGWNEIDAVQLVGSVGEPGDGEQHLRHGREPGPPRGGDRQAGQRPHHDQPRRQRDREAHHRGVARARAERPHAPGEPRARRGHRVRVAGAERPDSSPERRRPGRPGPPPVPRLQGRVGLPAGPRLRWPHRKPGPHILDVRRGALRVTDGPHGPPAGR